MSSKLARIAAVAALLTLAGCGGKSASTGADKSPPTQPAEAGYVTPPLATGATGDAAGVVLTGTARPGSRVRMATPAGAASTVVAGADGRWSLRVAPEGEARIYGLSMTAAGRQVQSQGYVLVTPQGHAAVLRAGAGAARLDRPPGAGAMTAFDFDRGGGAVVAGFAPPNAVVVVRLDGRQSAQGRAGDDGRFAIALPPLPRGAHRLQVFGDGVQDEAQVTTSPAPPLVGGPLRSQLTGEGLRADWLTPGGGIQSTMIFD